MSRAVDLPPGGKPLADGAVRGGWWHDAEDGQRIVCDLCPRECQLKPGDRGFCFVRENRDGEMVLTTYGRSTGFCIDPIEKKPLNHFLPGTGVLSFGTAGCNLGCKFCQNWDISKSREVERLSAEASPAAIAAAAKNTGCRSVAYTYNDPVIWAEYAIDTARECHEVGIRNVAVTAGYICPSARGPFFEYMDAANVDLKAFSEEFYWGITYSHLQPILESLEWLKKETNVWFEITNLLIPDANDSPDEIRQMCDWILKHLGDDVPIHFTAFHPDFRMQDRSRTPHETLLAARDIALGCGIKYGYVGNVNDTANQSTYCPGCEALLIERNWYELGRYALDGSRCQNCGQEVPGVFEDAPGTWGRKRQPIDMSQFAAATPAVTQISLPSSSSPAQQAAAGPTQAPEQVDSTTMSESVIATPPLTTQQEQAILDATCRLLLDTVWRRPPDLPDQDLAGAANRSVMGVFVTAKRQGRLRGCCGSMGQPMRLIEALYNSATRTALEDPRFPPISPVELPYLDLDVTLLSEFQLLAQEREERLSSVTVGLHGLQIQRGDKSGLLLPVVATDNGWDAEEFLRQVCRKASLPVTAWEDPESTLRSFEGHAIEGKFDPHAFDENQFCTAGPLPREDVQLLAQHATRNIQAIATGGTPFSYLSSVTDTPVLSLVLVLFDAAGNQVGQLSQHSLRPALPLQSTLFQMCEQAARAGGRAAANFTAELAVMTDVAIHGSAAKVDLGGVTANRSLLVVEGQRSFLRYDEELGSTALFESAFRDEDLTNPAAATVFSLATTSTTPSVAIRNVPRGHAGPERRPAAVAGSFYPVDPKEVDELLDEIVGDEDVRAADWPAAMIPHAGWRYSGKLAAQVLKRIKIPDTVFVIGPKHTDLGVDMAVAPHHVWELPGADVDSDPELARQLAAAIPHLELDAGAHAREHAVEVELPIIARLAPKTKVLGLAIGRGDLATYRAFALALADFIEHMPSSPLLLISSDMNHFANDAENRRLDEMALKAMESLDSAALYETVQRNSISMCGMGPAVIVMETLKHLGRLTRCERVGYMTSGEVGGDLSRVVGYAGMLLG